MSKSQSIIGRILSRIENWLTRSHLNPWQTLYANLRLLPLSQALRFPIYVYGTASLIDLGGCVEFDCPVKRGIVRLNVKDLAPAPRGNDLEICLRGTLRFHGAALIRSNTKIYVDNDATLDIGHNLRMGSGIIINCLNSIVIGEGVRIGHRGQLLDSNLHYIINMKNRSVAPLKKSIRVGDHSWLTNSVTVLGGANIPAYSIVVSGTVANKDLSSLGEGNIIGGSPARLLASDMRLVNNYAKEQELGQYFREHPDADSYHLPGEINMREWFENEL